MSTADIVAAILMAGVGLYALFGFADFGAGFWDLTAGRGPSATRTRELLDRSIRPVWEANHVWLIFCLVFFWTAFGPAFASVMTTLFVPLTLAALGIVLRGANFAYRKEAARAGTRHVAGELFGVASVITPFFFGAVVGGIVSERVPPGNAAGDLITSWWNPSGIVLGALAVALAAFVAATYLVREAHHAGADDLRDAFRRRGVWSGVVALVLGGAALATLSADAGFMYHRFVTRGAPLLVVGAGLLVVAVVMLARGQVLGTRVLAAGAVAALVAAWAVAQYPYLLPPDLTVDDAAGASATLTWLIVWFVAAVLVVVPVLVMLYTLDQEDRLGDEGDVSVS